MYRIEAPVVYNHLFPKCPTLSSKRVTTLQKCTSLFLTLLWIGFQIRFDMYLIDLAVLDTDPGAWKLSKINK
jgi:hypothetical protein